MTPLPCAPNVALHESMAIKAGSDPESDRRDQGQGLLVGLIRVAVVVGSVCLGPSPLCCVAAGRGRSVGRPKEQRGDVGRTLRDRWTQQTDSAAAAAVSEK